MSKYELRRLRMIADSVVGNNVLDIGYADMPNPFLSNYYCVGYDIAKPISSAGYNEEIEGDVREIKYKLRGYQFDTIIAGELIEHLENPYEFLRDIHPLLVGPKRLILSTPNPFSFPVFICELFQIKKFFYTKEHLYYFLPRWVERLLDFSGFRLQKIKSVGLATPIFILPCPAIMSYQLIYIAHRKKS